MVGSGLHVRPVGPYVVGSGHHLVVGSGLHLVVLDLLVGQGLSVDQGLLVGQCLPVDRGLSVDQGLAVVPIGLVQGLVVHQCH